MNLMAPSGSSEKAAKKAAKARLKYEKKFGPRSGGEDGTADKSTPAERSAAAAERQVVLQKYRVLLALISALIGFAAVLLAIRPWG